MTWSTNIVGLAGFLISGACANKSFGTDAATPDVAAGQDGGRKDESAPAVEPDLGPIPDVETFSGVEVVYAHTAQTLYRIDPDTLGISSVGTFAWPADVTFDSMTDLAINRDGQMVGISTQRVYAVNPDTAECTRLASFSGSGFVGLSFLPSSDIDAETEVLVAASWNGSVIQIDPDTGATTPLGNYGGDLGASGDLVSVVGAGTFATVTSEEASDSLAVVDPLTGVATVVGSGTGFSDIFGLGFWAGTVYGFTASGEFILIDVKTGVGSLVSENPVLSWWGAAVTTIAPHAPD